MIFAPGAPRGRPKVGVSFNGFKKMSLKRGVQMTQHDLKCLFPKFEK